MKFLLILFLGLAFAFETLGQSFVNGDLEGGPITWTSVLPDNWQNVPLNDINCLCFGLATDSPDLADLTEPFSSGGFNGNPFSGATFLSGYFGSSTSTNQFFQEGIMQTVSGFSVGENYSIRFRQTVAKVSNALDHSGSWAIYIDTILAGITTPSQSYLTYNSTSMVWDARQINFTASSTSHLIKFLPMDDDTNYAGSQTDTMGALYMGIDSIGLEVVTGINEPNVDARFKVFPNPNNGSFVFEGSNNNLLNVSIQNTAGTILYYKNMQPRNKHVKIDDAALVKGIYFVKVTTEYGMQCLKLVVQ